MQLSFFAATNCESHQRHHADTKNVLPIHVLQMVKGRSHFIVSIDQAISLNKDELRQINFPTSTGECDGPMPCCL